MAWFFARRAPRMNPLMNFLLAAEAKSWKATLNSRAMSIYLQMRRAVGD